MYTAPTDIYTLSLHDALPIFHHAGGLTCLPENVRHGAVNLGVPTAAPFVMQVPRVPDTGEHEAVAHRSEEHTSELQSHHDLVCRLLLEKKKKQTSKQPAGQ